MISSFNAAPIHFDSLIEIERTPVHFLLRVIYSIHRRSKVGASRVHPFHVSQGKLFSGVEHMAIRKVETNTSQQDPASLIKEREVSAFVAEENSSGCTSNQILCQIFPTDWNECSNISIAFQLWKSFPALRDSYAIIDTEIDLRSALGVPSKLFEIILRYIFYP